MTSVVGFKGKEVPLVFSMTGMLCPSLEVEIKERFILDDGPPTVPCGDDGTWATVEDRSVTFTAVPIGRPSAAVEALGANGLRLTGSWL